MIQLTREKTFIGTEQEGVVWVLFIYLKPKYYLFDHVTLLLYCNYREKEVEAALSSVKPGWNYLSRLVSSIEQLIQSKIPKRDKY